jgi:hypothetical protein
MQTTPKLAKPAAAAGPASQTRNRFYFFEMQNYPVSEREFLQI